MIVNGTQFFPIKIPVYIEVGIKNPKTIFLSLNWYRNCNFHTSNKVKEMVEDMIIEQLNKLTLNKMKQYTVSYHYNYKSKTSDLPNVCALASKYLNDALKAKDLIEDDNVQYLVGEQYYVGLEDKEDPHIYAMVMERHETTGIDHRNLE